MSDEADKQRVRCSLFFGKDLLARLAGIWPVFVLTSSGSMIGYAVLWPPVGEAVLKLDEARAALSCDFLELFLRRVVFRGMLTLCEIGWPTAQRPSDPA